MISRLLWFAGVLIAFLAGTFLGHYATRFHTLDFKKELGLGDVLNFSVTILFAYVLQNYLAKRFGNERASKDHIIDLTKEAGTFFKDSRSAFISEYEKRRLTKEYVKEIKARLRNLSNSISLLEETLVDCKCTDEMSDFAKVKANYLAMKRALTGGNFPTKSYDAEAFADAETAYGIATSSLNKIRIKLNQR